ncbi:unnamed protein product [Eruca vesicaria subsp. sativa]|uniref:Uncharacterized protein n=1 Tax=Eruca vesicaria subsp. sativa TaxID=29727 RepID=A0ABC8M7V0_ERUVS|nr:unnamed protein product [Eruca vesicaria subsp. sativa]
MTLTCASEAAPSPKSGTDSSDKVQINVPPSLLHTLFAFEFSLVMWILSKVVVLS